MPFAIHASREVDEDVCTRLQQGEYGTIKVGPGGDDLPKEAWITSAIIGIATIDSIIKTPLEARMITFRRPEWHDQQKWFFDTPGNVGYVLRDVRSILHAPITGVKGAVSFWELQPDHHALLTQRLQPL